MERTSARGIILTEQNKAVLIRRVKAGNEYYVVPGGGVEEGETPEVAVVREADEELGVQVSVQKRIHEIRVKLGDVDTLQIFFLCKHEGGKIGTGKGPEFRKNDPQNVYEVVQIDKHQIGSLNVQPADIKELLVKALNNEELPEIYTQQ